MKTSFLPVLLVIAFLGYAPHTYAKGKKDNQDANKTAIDIIVDSGPATTEDVLAPLGAKVMPEKKVLKMTADITALREKLLDEVAKTPAASPAAYKAAVGLCNAWLNALDERDKIAGNKSQAPIATTDMNSNTPVHPGEYALEQEAIDAKKKRQADAKENAFFNDAQKKQWEQRSTQWHQYLDQLYAQLGALRRQGDQTASAAPAAIPATPTAPATTTAAPSAPPP